MNISLTVVLMKIESSCNKILSACWISVLQWSWIRLRLKNRFFNITLCEFCEGQYYRDAIILLSVFSPTWCTIALSDFYSTNPIFGATMFYSIRGSSYFRFAFIGISRFSPILYMSPWASTGVAFRTSQYSLPFDFGVHYVEVGWLYYSRQSSFSDFSAIWRGYFFYISR